MIDVKLAMYLAGTVFTAGVAWNEFRSMSKRFDEYKKDRAKAREKAEREREKKDDKVTADVEGIRKRKASKDDLETLRKETERDVNGIGKKAEDVRGEVKSLDDREDRRFRELALILGRMTDDPAVLGAIQHMASRNGG